MFICILHCLALTSVEAATRYLSYTPYWGLSNQLQELNVAANWAHFLDRTLVLPTYAQSRSTPDGVEPNAIECESDQTNCEQLSSLINLDRLREYVPVVLEQDYAQEEEAATIFTVDFGIDFSDKTNRITFLLRWMEDPDRHVLRAYKRTEKGTETGTETETEARTEVGTETTTRHTPKWCEQGVQLGPHRCQRSAQELVDQISTTIHFPAFTTFTVGRIWAASSERRDLLNKRSNHYVGPSAEVLRVARRVRRSLLSSSLYNSVHVRLGDFLTEEWAKQQVKSNEDRAATLFKDLDDTTLPLYIATNDDDDAENIARVYSNAGFQRVVMWPKQQEFLKVSMLIRSMAEQTICAGGQQFDAQSGSTFSGLIDLVRSSVAMMKLHGYLLGEDGTDL